LTGAGSALAQDANLPETQARQGAGAAAAAAGANEAAQMAPLGPNETVTYAQVLQAPADISLNYRFALSEIRAGRLKSASATLDRILLAHPDLAEVRLLYAIVLYRLDSDTDAVRELDTVSRMTLPPAIKTQVETYRAAIEKRRRTTRYSFNLSVGLQGDTNRSATPTDNKVLFIDIPLKVSKSKADGALLAIGSFRVEHDPGFQDRHTLFAQTTSYMDEQHDLRRQSFQFHSAETGVNWNLPKDAVTTSMTLEHMRMQDRPYMLAFGPKLRLQHRIDAEFDVFGQVQYRWQNFNNISATVDGSAVAPLASNRSGARFDAEVGGRWTINPANQLELSFNLTDKNAEVGYEAYKGEGVQLSHTWLLGNGQFLLSNAQAGLQIYDQRDSFISAKTRRDWTYLGRVTYGVPVANLLPEDTVPQGLAGLVMTTSVEAQRVKSSIANYDYSTIRGQWLLSKRWEF
jgi:hypothetical protein